MTIVKKLLGRALFLLGLFVVMGIGYHFTPVYKLSEAVYWEGVHQSTEEQWAIRWVIANRKDMGRPEWGDTFHSVIHGGANRGNNRDFTYVDHRGTRAGITEGMPILPYVHALRRDEIRWQTVWRINWQSLQFFAGYLARTTEDSTNGAVFYKVTGHPNSWFEREIAAGRMCNPHRIDAHTFYNLCASGLPVF